MKLFFTDTETTGLPKDWKAPVTDSANWPRCIEVATIATTKTETVDSRFAHSFLIKPIGFEIPEEASKVHGITTAMAMEQGADGSVIFPQIHEQMLIADCLVGHNIRFDLQILNAEFHRLGLSIIERPMLCTMMSGRRYDQKGKWPKLIELYKALFLKDFEDAHRAASDLEATEECFKEMVRRNDIKLPEVPRGVSTL